MSLWLWVWVCIMSYVLWVYICVIYNQGWVKRHDMYTWYVFSEFCLNIVKKKILNINTKYRWKHQSILSFLFTLHNSNLLLCLHLLTSSDLFFIKLQSLAEIWWKMVLTFLAILHLTIGVICWFFKLQIYFESLVHFKFTLKYKLDNVHVNKTHVRQCLYIISLYFTEDFSHLFNFFVVSKGILHV